MPYSLIVAASLMLVSVLIGKTLSQKFKDKAIFYKALLKFNSNIINSINFRRDDLTVLLSLRTESEFLNKLLNQKFESIKGNKIELNTPSFLIECEKKELLDYFNGIGKRDYESEIKVLYSYNDYFLNKVKTCDTEVQNQGVLYKKISIAVGLIIFIIVI